MANPSLIRAIGKLALAAEQAGLSINQMIEMLNSGMNVETLLELITCRLQTSATPSVGARWIDRTPFSVPSRELVSGTC